jgi:hypothetical protein
MIFAGGTCGSVHAQTFNDNLKELGVVESKRNTIRKGLVHELLNAQDTVLYGPVLILCAEIRRAGWELELGKHCGRSFPRARQLYMRFGEKRWDKKKKTELLNAQDTVLCSHLAQRSGERGEHRSKHSVTHRTVEEAFQGLDSFI